MFRPSASSTYSSAMSRMRTQALPKYCATKGAIASTMVAAIQVPSLLSLRFMVGFLVRSGAVGDTLAEQALRAQRQHEDQHDEGEDVLVMAAQHVAGQVADVAGTERLDHAERHAADHRAGQVADAA